MFVATLLVGAFLVLLQLPMASAADGLPWMAGLWVSLLPAACLLQSSLPLPPLSPEAMRLFPDSYMHVDDERRRNGRTALVAVYAAQALLLAFTLKLRMSAALSSREDRLPAGDRAPKPYRVSGAAAERAAGFLGACLPSGIPLVPVDRVAALKVPPPLSSPGPCPFPSSPLSPFLFHASPRASLHLPLVVHPRCLIFAALFLACLYALSPRPSLEVAAFIAQLVYVGLVPPARRS